MSLAFVQADHSGAGDWPSKESLPEREAAIIAERERAFAEQEERLASRARVNIAKRNVAMALADLRAMS